MFTLFTLGLLLSVVLPNAALYVALKRTRRRLPVCDPEDEELALPAGVYAGAFVAECGSTIAAAFLALGGPLQPVRRGDPRARVRVVVLHGWAQSRGVVSVIASRLAAHGFGVVSFSYPTRTADVVAAAAGLRRVLVDLQEERQGPIHLLGFGLGGLVARYCVRRHRLPGVRRLMTLGTPHLGTLLAPRWAGGLGRLHPESEFIRHLAAADRAPDQFEATAIQSEFDATILPPDNAYYPAAFNVIVRDSGHFTLLFSRRIFALILENLEVGEGA